MAGTAVVIFGLGQDIWMLSPTQVTIVLVVSSASVRACNTRSRLSPY